MQERCSALLGLGAPLRLALGSQPHRPAEMLTRLDALERPTRLGTESRALTSASLFWRPRCVLLRCLGFIGQWGPNGAFGQTPTSATH